MAIGPMDSNGFQWSIDLLASISIVDSAVERSMRDCSLAVSRFTDSTRSLIAATRTDAAVSPCVLDGAADGAVGADAVALLFRC